MKWERFTNKLNELALFLTLLLICEWDLCSEVLENVNRDVPKIRVEGGRFVSDKNQLFIPFGVNYFRPGTGWAPQLWKKFDPGLVRQDFQRMHELGVNCVRVFITFGSFFSSPETLDEAGLSKFDEFLKIAERYGIYVHPTGPDHWEGVPEWAKSDRFSDELFLKAQEQFWRLFATRYRGRNIIFAYDLLNEPGVYWDSFHIKKRWASYLRTKYKTQLDLARAWNCDPQKINWEDLKIPDLTDNKTVLLEYQQFRENIATEWVKRQTQVIHSVDSNALVTVGLIQWSVPVILPGVQHYSGFNPRKIAPYVDFMEIHFYPLATGFYEYQSHEDLTLNLAYAYSLVQECALAKKPVVIAEFGWYGGGRLTIDQGKHRPASEVDQASWCKSIIRTTYPVAIGWLNWGLYDHPEAKDVSQLTGLLTVDGKIKAWGYAFKELSQSINAKFGYVKNFNHEALDWSNALVNPGFGREHLNKYSERFAKYLSQVSE